MKEEYVLSLTDGSLFYAVKDSMADLDYSYHATDNKLTLYFNNEEDYLTAEGLISEHYADLECKTEGTPE
jgi:hypothetical protein